MWRGTDHLWLVPRFYFASFNLIRLTNRAGFAIIKSSKGGLIMTRRERKRLERDKKRANIMLAIAILELLIQIIGLLK